MMAIVDLFILHKINHSLIVGNQGNIGHALYTHLKSITPNTYGTSHKEITDKNTFHLNLAEDPSTWDFQNKTFDVAYLTAGICRMNKCEEDPTSTYKTNVQGMSALAKQLAANNTFIVYLSTNQVFSGKHPYAKTDEAYAPSNEYGRQKAAIETFIRENCPRHAIVRLTKVVEPNMALIKNWMQQLTTAQSFNAFHDMPLAPVSLNQVITTLVKIGETQKTGIYHISGEKDVSYYELATFLAKKLDCPSNLVKSISALDANIQENFLPRFTSLDCSSTIDLSGQTPPTLAAVLQECFAIK